MLRRPPRSTRLTHSFPTRRSSDLGCVLNALPPAPVSTRHVIGQMLPDVVFGCLRQIIPERVPAEGASCVWLLALRGATQDASRGRYGFTLRSEEHTSELQSLMRISYAVFCLKTNKKTTLTHKDTQIRMDKE